MKLLFFLLLISFQVSAIELTDAFNSLISMNKPGAYESQTRGYMAGGDFTVHFPSDNVQLVSISPPNDSAGCSGISIYLGGFSYISGQQFTSLLKNISTSALGYSFQLALRTLCPICSTVVADLQRAAQSASKLALDQCQLSENLIQNGIQSNSILEQWISGNGANAETKIGGANDYLAAMHELMGNITLALDKIAERINNISDPGARQQAAQEIKLGSTTWNMLAGLTDIQKIFIQSLIGTSMLVLMPTNDGDNKKAIVAHLPPTLTPESLGKVFLFGAQAKENKYTYVWQCAEAPSELFSAINICENPKKVLLTESSWYKRSSLVNNISVVDYGFFGVTYALLFQALYNIENRHSLGSAEKIQLPAEIYHLTTNSPIVLQPAFTAEQITAFISLSPLPLYRALNIAAIYPDIAEPLIGNVASVVASNYSLAYIKQLLDIKHADNSSGGTLGLSPRDYAELEATLRNISSTLDQRMSALLTNLQTNEAWTAHINQVQSMVYAQILASGLVNNFAYSIGLAGGNI